MLIKWPVFGIHNYLSMCGWPPLRRQQRKKKKKSLKKASIFKPRFTSSWKSLATLFILSGLCWLMWKRVFRSDGTAVAYSVKGTLDTMKYYKHVHVTVVSCNKEALTPEALAWSLDMLTYAFWCKRGKIIVLHITPRKSAEWNSPGKMFRKAHGNSSHMGCVMFTCDRGASWGGSYLRTFRNGTSQESIWWSVQSSNVSSLDQKALCAHNERSTPSASHWG